MPNYLLTWEMAVEADSRADALRQGHGVITDPDNTATFLRATECNEDGYMTELGGVLVDAALLSDREHLLGEIADWSEMQPAAYEDVLSGYTDVGVPANLTTEELADVYVEYARPYLHRDAG